MSIPVYSISDLHLNGGNPAKAQSRFGGVWAEHPGKLLREWHRTIPSDAIVLLPGDLSWGTSDDAVIADWALINGLHGQLMVLSPGNHDYGLFKTASKARHAVESAGLSKLFPIRNAAVRFRPDGAEKGLVIAAVKGSLIEGDRWFNGSDVTAQDATDNARHYARETGRLRIALDEAAKLREPGDVLVVMIHYPSFINLHEESSWTHMISAANADFCVYGHIHSPELHSQARQGLVAGVEYRLVAVDYLQMRPSLILSL